MIVVDTTVFSEPMRANGDPAVADWLDRQRPDTLFLTTVTLAELLLGLELMPLGLRRSRLEARIGEVINTFGERQTLAFDSRAARAFAVSVARARECEAADRKSRQPRRAIRGGASDRTAA